MSAGSKARTLGPSIERSFCAFPGRPCHKQCPRHTPSTVCVCVSVPQSCLSLCNSMECSPPGSSVHGIFQVRILEWVAISIFLTQGSNWVSCIAGKLFPIWATREALIHPGNSEFLITSGPLEGGPDIQLEESSMQLLSWPQCFIDKTNNSDYLIPKILIVRVFRML